MEEDVGNNEKVSRGFNLNYKMFLVIPIVLLLFSVGFLVNGYIQTGEWFERAIELKGGTLVSITLPEPVDINNLERILSQKFGDVSIRELRSFSGYGVQIQTGSEVEADSILSELKTNGIDTSRSYSATIGPALGESFWRQAQMAILIAFVFMGIIVFAIFRKLVPSFAVILAAFSDILVTLAFMQIFGIELSLAALAALLMLLGYSIDTDIMLTTRLVKTGDDGNIKHDVREAFKTGITMTGTTIGALVALLLSAISPVLSQIAAVLLIGLVVDICMTWFQNSVLLRWNMERED